MREKHKAKKPCRINDLRLGAASQTFSLGFDVLHPQFFPSQFGRVAHLIESLIGIMNASGFDLKKENAILETDTTRHAGYRENFISFHHGCIMH